MWPFKKKASEPLSETTAIMRETSRNMSKVLNLMAQRKAVQPELLDYLKKHENDIVNVERLPDGSFLVTYPKLG